MGDMNDDPHEDLLAMHNLMCHMKPETSHIEGTYKYRGVWSYLDQCYLSKSLQNRPTELFVYAPDYLLEDDERYLGSQPKRTYIGMRYHGGCSDHLPIVLKMVSKL